MRSRARRAPSRDPRGRPPRLGRRVARRPSAGCADRGTHPPPVDRAHGPRPENRVGQERARPRRARVGTSRGLVAVVARSVLVLAVAVAFVFGRFQRARGGAVGSARGRRSRCASRGRIGEAVAKARRARAERGVARSLRGYGGRARTARRARERGRRRDRASRVRARSHPRATNGEARRTSSRRARDGASDRRVGRGVRAARSR